MVKLPGYVTTKHKDKSEVIHSIALDKTDTKRLKILKKMRNDRRLLRKKKILANGCGELKTK